MRVDTGSTPEQTELQSTWETVQDEVIRAVKDVIYLAKDLGVSTPEDLLPLKDIVRITGSPVVDTKSVATELRVALSMRTEKEADCANANSTYKKITDEEIVSLDDLRHWLTKTLEWRCKSELQPENWLEAIDWNSPTDTQLHEALLALFNNNPNDNILRYIETGATTGEYSFEILATNIIHVVRGDLDQIKTSAGQLLRAIVLGEIETSMDRDNFAKIKVERVEIADSEDE